jgi:hypothetical protein
MGQGEGGGAAACLHHTLPGPQPQAKRGAGGQQMPGRLSMCAPAGHWAGSTGQLPACTLEAQAGTVSMSLVPTQQVVVAQGPDPLPRRVLPASLQPRHWCETGPPLPPATARLLYGRPQAEPPPVQPQPGREQQPFSPPGRQAQPLQA